MTDKQYISAQQLLEDSFRLGARILKSGFRPNFIVGVWRGGSPVGIAVQELLHYFGVDSDHISIRTSSYTGIGERTATCASARAELHDPQRQRRGLTVDRRRCL